MPETVQHMHIPSLPPMEALLAFRTAVESGSFAAAARSLSLSHATVLRRVQSLEGWLGTKVLHRTAQGVELTPAGQRFARDVERILDILTHSAERWTPVTAPAKISLSVLPAFARLWLMPRLPQLIGSPQRYRIELSQSYKPVSLGDGQFDVAVRYGQGPWDGVQSIPLRRERLIPAAHPNLATAKLSPREIAALPLIHDSDISGWKAWFGRNEILFRLKAKDMRFEDYDLALDAARLGLGAILVRSPDGTIPHPLVALHSDHPENPHRHFILIAASEERMPVRRFVEKLVSLLGADAKHRVEQ